MSGSAFKKNGIISPIPQRNFTAFIPNKIEPNKLTHHLKPMFAELPTNRNINQFSEEYPSFQNFNFGYNPRIGGIGKLDPQEVSYTNVFNLSPLVAKPPPKPSSTGLKSLTPFSSIDNMNNPVYSQN